MAQVGFDPSRKAQKKTFAVCTICPLAMLCPGCGQEKSKAEWRPSQWKNHSPSDPLGQFRYCRSCEAGPALQPGLQSRADEPEELVQWTANWSDVFKAKVVGNHKGYTILSSQGTVFLGLLLES